MLNATHQDFYYRKGEYNGEAKYQTVDGNPFIRWAKKCPVEAERGNKKIDDFRKELDKALQEMKKQ